MVPSLHTQPWSTDTFHSADIVNLYIEAETSIIRSYSLVRFEAVQYLVSSNLLYTQKSVYVGYSGYVCLFVEHGF